MKGTVSTARLLGLLALAAVASACTSPSASGTGPSTQPSAAGSPSAVPTPTPVPLPDVVVGQLARVMVDAVTHSAAPGVMGQTDTGVIAAGELVTVLDGPAPGEGQRWWEVEVSAVRGWVADVTADGTIALLDAAEPASREWNLWAAMRATELPAAVADLPHRIYVPNEADGTVSVIDPGALEVIDTLPVGVLPEHVTPGWDLSRFYVSNYASAFLSIIGAASGELLDPVLTPNPYNLYFSPDGVLAIVMAEEIDRIDIYERSSWTPVAHIPVAFRGIDHADFSAGGAYLLATTEYTGHVLKVDLLTHTIVADLVVGGEPIDVKVAPDGSVFYVANQTRHGVSIVDPVAMTEIGFLATGTGAHGMAISRDTRSLYVANREAGTISVIDFATRTVVDTWDVGGSPDMLTLSPDGSVLWTSNRFASSISGIDTAFGTVVLTIEVGGQPHGLTYFPQPGRFSIGHNGVYR